MRTSSEGRELAARATHDLRATRDGSRGSFRGAACWNQADLVVARAPYVSSALPAVGTPKCLPAEERVEDVGRVSSARGCEFVLYV